MWFKRIFWKTEVTFFFSAAPFRVDLTMNMTITTIAIIMADSLSMLFV